MALKQLGPSDKNNRTFCPRCGEEAIIIDGRTVKWLTCPKCKFKKLMEKEDEGVRVTNLK